MPGSKKRATIIPPGGMKFLFETEKRESPKSL
jgi:hypothetical protein